MVEEIKSILEKLQKMTVEELASYDVKLEDEVLRKYINENASSCEWPLGEMDDLSPWERMCYYKVSGRNGTDCDVALFTVVVYYLAYGLEEKGWKINKYRRVKGKYQLENPEEGWDLRGDTMNSYATTVHSYIRDIWMQLPNKMTDMVRNKIIILKQKKWEVNSEFKTNYWEDVILRKYDDYFKGGVLHPEGLEYIRLNHTIGNFIPVPFVEGGGQFNSPRGVDGSSEDFWDLALLAIYHYYYKDFCKKEYPSFALRWLLGDVANVRLCQNWLDSFEGASGEEKWDTFVKQNYMQAFVEKKNDHYGMPISLWKDHFAGKVMPEGEQYDEFFNNASKRIAARGKEIAQKTKNELEGKDLAILADKMVCGYDS